MSKFIKCKTCAGLGKIMGGGMIQVICEECTGIGSVEIADNEIDYLEMRKTDGYQKAKKRLMKRKKLSVKEAEELLDNELKQEFL